MKEKLSPVTARALLRPIVSSPWFALASLTITFTIGFIDRQLVNLLVQPIKSDFHLSDIQVSLLQGAAFSITYLLMSPFFGRWVDVSDRRRILLYCIVIWSVFTAACGLARNYLMLFLMRSGVGAAEAGLTPASWSILSDIFDEKRLARALSIYNLGPYLGNGLAMLLGGILLEWTGTLDTASWPGLSGLRPWQLTFIIISMLSLVSIVMVAALREPQRSAPKAAGSAAPMSLGEAGDVFRRNRRFYGWFYAGMALATIPIYAFPAWLPALAVRQYGVSIGHVGVTYGMVTLVFGSLGVLTGPLAARLLERAGYHDANIRVGVFAGIAVLACCVALFFRSSFEMVLIIGAVASFCYSLPTAMAATALQIVTPSRMRGFASSIYIVMVTLMGLGVAPVSVALLTDMVFRDEMRVGDSLAITCGFFAAVSTVAIIRCMSGYRQCLDQRAAV